MEDRSESHRVSPSILVVDGSEPMRHQLQLDLEKKGFEVHGVADGYTCLEALRTRQPDLVLIDSVLPDERGADLCHAIQCLPEGLSTPILLMLAYEELDDLSEALESGAHDVLVKPVHAGLLIHRVRRALAEHAGRSSRAASLEPPESFSSHAAMQRATDAQHFHESLASAIPLAKGAGKSVALLFLSVDADGGEPGADSSDSSLDGPILVRIEQALAAIRDEGPADGSPSGEVLLAQPEPGRFSLLLPLLERVQDAAKLGARIQEFVGRPMLVGTGEVRPSVSIGVSTSPADGSDPAELQKCAEVAAYCAKQQGRNQLEFYTAQMSRWAFERLTLEHSLRQAVERDELELYYQPRIQVRTGRIIGVEALIRWNHPQLGMVSPAQFIPLAEETGLIVPIGEWVLQTACKQVRTWQDAGLPAVRVSVNLSPAQFRQPDLFDTVSRALSEASLDPEWLELELTESMLMQSIKKTQDTLRRLKAAGIHLSIDDFGTGYSSLSYLRRFPIDALKIDQSFVREVTSNPDDAAIATAIILMGRSLKLSVVAEGVETNSQLKFLRVLHCDEVQGYLFSPPVPAREAALLIASPKIDTSAA